MLAPAPQPRAEWIATQAGRLRILVIEARSAERDRPVILHFHGGGYIAGTPDLRVPILQEAARQTGAAVVSVDYRLAPEHPAPAAIDDAMTSYQWVAACAKARGWDASRIAIVGDSAGGGIAAALALRLRKLRAKPVQLVLIYPMLDDRTTASDGEVGRNVWTARSNAYAWRSYLGTRVARAEVVPARAKDVSGLPPTWIGVGTADLFAREDVAFATRLRVAKVRVELHIAPGAYHGFDEIAPNAKVSTRFQASWISALHRAFTR
jgi:acetyl esterase/lipase